MKKNNLSYLLGIIMALMSLSCSTTRFLEEGELLYNGADVKVKGESLAASQRKAMEKELLDLTRPNPNKKFLGMRMKLYFYYLAGNPSKQKGFRHWLKYKVGEPPVLLSQVDRKYNEQVLQSFLENRGYFLANTESDTLARKKKTRVVYRAVPGPQYYVREVFFPEDSTSLSKAIREQKGDSFLKPGKPYDFESIRNERERIDSRLKEKGYYYFNPDYLLVRIDSTIGNHQADLYLTVKKEVPSQARDTYRIGNIVVYPNYTIGMDSIRKQKEGTPENKEIKIIDPENTFKPRIFDQTFQFKKGEPYNRTDHNLTLNRLVTMGTFKFVKNQFSLSDSIPNTLDAYYYLTPFPKKSIRFELAAKTNSANYNGTELSVNWSNRNAFKGAELLTISVFGGMEVQVSGQNKGFNIFRTGVESALIWPRVISPFKIRSSSAFVPKTKVGLGYEFQDRRKLYTLQTFRGSFGYLWKENIRKEHQLNIMDASYSSPLLVTGLYSEQINLNPALERVIEKQFIFGPTYSFTYTNTMDARKRNTFYYRGAVDASATLAGLISGANARGGEVKEVFGVPFSQYLKTESEIRHYLKLGGSRMLASRFIAGVAIPYGNSTQVPFIKQFFIGGTNSIRAFRARSIGPGSYNFSENNTGGFLPDESGDIKFEANVELRGTLHGFLKGAVFIDAGNIWLINTDENKPGAVFTKDFIKEIAVGTGVGLRFDFSILILRTDLAFPLRRPHLEEGNRWVIDDIRFGSRSWRRDNLVFNLAIGYPF